VLKTNNKETVPERKEMKDRFEAREQKDFNKMIKD
jgi:hypothetical protein